MRSDTTLRIALPKGRIYEEAVELFHKSGIHVDDVFANSRKLHAYIPELDVELILAKPMDVPTYVGHGVADIGVAGSDVLQETDHAVYELLDLQISKCRLSVAGVPGHECATSMPKIATKYPRIATNYYRERGKQVEIIPLNGSIELAPILGLSDYIVDIVSTGKTLRDNGLVEVEWIGDVSSRLIANRAMYRMKQARIETLLEQLRSALQKEETAR
ncbi:MAG: ATP phosphoribosyltransferase [Bacilli bacterium]